MLVRTLYFAGVRDVTGVAEETLELPPDVRTVGGFETFLTRRYPGLAAHAASLRYARNEVFAEPTEALAEGDVLAVIPPVAGG